MADLAAAGAAAARAVAEAPSPRTPPPKRDAAGEAVTPEKSREPARGQPPWARLLPRKSSEDLSRYDSRLHFKAGLGCVFRGGAEAEYLEDPRADV